jgi:hypothetical protein
MTRIGWRMSAWSTGIQVFCFALLAFSKYWAVKFPTGDALDSALFWIFSLIAVVGVVWFLYLLRVRRNDAPFWDEEEARRADWDRRGRQL